MILQALYELYQRKSADEYDPLPPFGWEKRGIDYVLEIDSDGNLKDIESTADQLFLVPQGVVGRSGSTVKPNLLWDKSSYVLGWDTEKSASVLQKEHRAFIEKIHTVFPNFSQDEGLRAVCTFLDRKPLRQTQGFTTLWKEISESKKKGLVFSFRLKGDDGLVCERTVVREAPPMTFGSMDVLDKNICLVTGEKLPIAKLHTMIKGVWKAQSGGAAIVSFNEEAYESFGKVQGANSPVSLKAADAYTKALNWLLRKESDLRTQLSETSVVFWAQNKQGKTFEENVSDLYGTDPEKHFRTVRSLYDAARRGIPPQYDKDTRFYVLGLAPNNARISIRFWHAAAIREFAGNIQHYFDDIALEAFVEGKNEKKWPMLWQIIAACAPKEKIDRLPDKLKNALHSELFESVNFGKRYPQKLMYLVLTRVRAESEVSDYRAAILKACLIRNFNMEVSMELDKTKQDVSFQLGRLFAVYDYIKEMESERKSNRRDKFFAAFCARPKVLLSRLDVLAGHDLKKLRRSKPGFATNREKEIQEIMQNLPKDIPLMLPVTEQALFVLGYYHQTAERKKSEADSDLAQAA